METIELLKEIDELLMSLEDHTHGEDGIIITRLRIKIARKVTLLTKTKENETIK